MRTNVAAPKGITKHFAALAPWTQLLSHGAPLKINTSCSRTANLLVQTARVHKPEEYSLHTHTHACTHCHSCAAKWPTCLLPFLCHYSGFSLRAFVLCILEGFQIMCTGGCIVVCACVRTHVRAHIHTHTILIQDFRRRCSMLVSYKLGSLLVRFAAIIYKIMHFLMRQNISHNWEE